MDWDQPGVEMSIAARGHSVRLRPTSPIGQLAAHPAASIDCSVHSGPVSLIVPALVGERSRPQGADGRLAARRISSSA